VYTSVLQNKLHSRQFRTLVAWQKSAEQWMQSQCVSMLTLTEFLTFNAICVFIRLPKGKLRVAADHFACFHFFYF